MAHNLIPTARWISVPAMVATVLNRLLVVLIALALVGRASTPLYASATTMGASDAPMTMTGAVPCDQMDMTGHDTGSGKSAPCNSMNFDCMLKMGCFATGATLAAIPATLSVPIAYDAVSYELAFTARTGLSLAPDPFPPKSLA